MSLLHSKGKSEKGDGLLKRGIQNSWLFRGMLISFAAAVGFSCFYGVFQENAEKAAVDPITRLGNIDWLYQNCFLLYRDLYNMQQESHHDYADIYLETDEKYAWLLDEEELEEIVAYEDIGAYEASEEADEISWEEVVRIKDELDNLRGYFEGLENGFINLNTNYDYFIQDNNTKEYMTNMSYNDIAPADNALYFKLSFQFDSAGNATVKEFFADTDDTSARKNANEVIRSNTLQSLVSSTLSSFNKYGTVSAPKDCTVTYSISKQNHQASKYAYVNAGTGAILFMGLLFVALLGCFAAKTAATVPWNQVWICSLPFEIIFTIGLFLVPFGSNAAISMMAWLSGGRAATDTASYLNISMDSADIITWCINFIILTLYFFIGWYLGTCAGAVRERGIIGYIKERSMIYRFFPFIKRKTIGVYNAIEHLDLTQNAHKSIIKLVLINAVVLFIISSLWFGGFAITIVYSILLYFVLRKYISDLQKKYSIFLKATNEMAEGNLNVTINEDLGIFEPFKPQVLKIQNGFRKAVDEEVKSQKMKAELITNVSHDLKTPLTAIITYINLLKEADITEEQRKEYLDILERKSLRLKSLIEDLFEVSKANSQNITLNRTDVDIMNLIKQVVFEMSDKLTDAGLDVRMNLTDEKIILFLDSQKTYRIYENLFGNIAKYAMKGTRVYVNGFRIDDRVVITLKNISAQEITVASEELTERFVRGDVSRNTEGSGLGLAIAKSFTELQGGELSLEVDGDLFKATTVWTAPQHNKNQ